MLNLLALDAANLLKTVLGIGGLIFFHELGHFLVALACGVRPAAFSIGFPPTAVAIPWRGIEYRIGLLPLGGYVKFRDDEAPPDSEPQPGEFRYATYPRKVAIMLAGVTMNVIVAFALFVTAFRSGVEMAAPVIGGAEPGYPAWEHGLETGDRIVEIEGNRIVAFEDVPQECALLPEVEIVVERGGVRQPPLRLPTRKGEGGIRRIGVAPPTVVDAIVRPDPDGAAAKAGLREGDVVVAVDGKPVASVPEAVAAHVTAKDESTWTVRRDGADTDVKVPVLRKFVVGILPDSESLVVRRGSPAAAAGFATGDRPVSVGGAATSTWVPFEAALRAAPAGTKVVVRRGGADVTLTLAGPAESRVAGMVGAPAAKTLVSPILHGEPGPAAAAGLEPGSELVTIDALPVKSFEDVRERVARAGREDRPVRATWRGPDGSERADVEIRPMHVPDAVQAELRLLQLGATEVVREETIFGAAALGFDRTHRWVMRIGQTLGSLFSGSLSATNLQGPVALARSTYQTADRSVTYLFLFLGMISMNLAVLNVLPIPMLDGGQLVMVTAERIRGRALPVWLHNGIQITGLVILLSFMLYVVVNDIRNL